MNSCKQMAHPGPGWEAVIHLVQNHVPVGQGPHKVVARWGREQRRRYCSQSCSSRAVNGLQSRCDCPFPTFRPIRICFSTGKVC
jgi:hypothetical protein